MHIKRFEESDYKTICSWWKEHDWPLIPLSFLPKTGIIVDGCAAGFLYSTDSGICWLEFVVADKKTEKEKRRRALDALIVEAFAVAKTMGFSALFTSVSHEGLVNRYRNHGFQITDKNMTNLVRIL